MSKWYRVVGFGLDGAVKRTPEDAWAAFEAAARRPHGCYACRDGANRAAHAAHLVVATTRRAAAAACVSGTHGRVGRGEWRRVQPVEEHRYW